MTIRRTISRLVHFPRSIYLSMEGKRIREGKLEFSPEGLNKDKRDIPELVVSLTSYPGRIDIVPGVVSSLLRQTVKPDRIILWLGIEKFPSRELPSIYDRIKDAGVEIAFRNDLKSHTKYFYAMQEFPDSIIITVDDDRIYNNDVIEKLVDSYLRYPQMISAMRVHRMRFDEEGSLLPYNEWEFELKGQVGTCSYQYFATGVGGVLYPPKLLIDETFHLEVIKEYCHNHDDMWLKVMEVLSGVKVAVAANAKKAYSHDIYNSQFYGQYIENVFEGGNDKQARAVLSYYNEWPGSGGNLVKKIYIDK